jgi:hypothetical protein
MGFFGNLLGQGLGYGVSKAFGGSDGVTNVAKDVGGSIGSLLPFRKGGRVKHKKGKKKAYRKGGLADENGYVMGGISKLNPAPNHAGYTLMPLPSRIKLM